MYTPILYYDKFQITVKITVTDIELFYTIYLIIHLFKVNSGLFWRNFSKNICPQNHSLKSSNLKWEKLSSFKKFLLKIIGQLNFLSIDIIFIKISHLKRCVLNTKTLKQFKRFLSRIVLFYNDFRINKSFLCTSN